VGEDEAGRVLSPGAFFLVTVGGARCLNVIEIALRSFFQSENMGIQNVKWVDSGLAAALSEDTVRTSD
jgi:hypothetical protein